MSGLLKTVEYVTLEQAHNNAEKFGFKNERGGVHLARTMMLEELKLLLSFVDDPEADHSKYLQAIKEENCLSKRSAESRNLTSRHLTNLYALDPNVTIFRALRFFWERDPAGQPLLALLCAYTRDSILRSSATFIQNFSPDEKVTRENLEEFIDNRDPGRFSNATLKSTAQNINATWTKSGHLKGRVKKIRSKPGTSCGPVAYSLLMGYLRGARGESFLKTGYAKLLDCSFERMIDLATEASRKGWIVFKRLGSVIEVFFPNLLTDQELEWVHEQNQKTRRFLQ